MKDTRIGMVFTSSLAAALLIASMARAQTERCTNAMIKDANRCGDNELDGVEECDGTADGACPGLCQSDCTCGCPGHVVGGACWLVGAAGESCNTVCANLGKEYDPATETFAGSGGTLANCEAVLDAFGTSASIAGPCGSGLGCCQTSGVGIYCSAPATTAAAADSDFSRFCACE